MRLYILIYLVPVIACFYNNQKLSKSTTFLAVYLSFLAIFVGLSDMFGGYDRYIYAEVFDSIADMTTRHESYLANGAFAFFEGEPGYVVLNILLSFITENRYIFILIYTLLIYVLLFVSLKRYAKNYPLALVLFMGLWFYFSFTYLRQVLGAAIAWLAIDYIVRRKLWKFVLVCAIAMSIHKSAIIFFPFYFIPVKKFSSHTILWVMGGCLVLGVSPIPNMLFNAYGDVSVVEQAGGYNASGGFRFAYLMEAAFFLWLLLSRRKWLPDNKPDIVLFNMALIFCAVLLFFIRSDNGGRLSWYYMIGILVSVSNLLSVGQKRQKQVLLMVVVSLFLYIRVYNAWQMFLNLYPYKTFLTNGYREGDYSFENYEYDRDYVVDKFYRKPFRWAINIGTNGNQ